MGDVNYFRRIFLPACLFLALTALPGCATSTVASRKQERLDQYHALPAEHRQLVDRGQIAVGMPPAAVYIAWGAPSEIVESETPTSRVTTWIYHGQWVEESRFWTYREVSRNDGIFLERYLETDYFPRTYIRAEIDFSGGEVIRWRTLPRPLP